MARADTFNRADTTGGLGTPSDAGSAWVEPEAQWGIASNQAYLASGGSLAPAVLESSIADCDVSVQVPTVAAGADIGIVVRYSDRYNYVLVQFGPAGGYKVFTRSGNIGSNTFTQLTTAAGNAASGDTIRVTANGTSIAGFVNGAQVITVTTAFNQAATMHGIWQNGGSGSTRFENFAADAYSAGGGGATLPGLERITRGQFRGQY